MTKPIRMLVAAPERWDEACFAVPAVRALGASGMRVGVVCAHGREDFWRALAEVEVVISPENTDLSAWEAALAWEYGPVVKAMRAAGVPRRIAPDGDRKLAKWATHRVALDVDVREHRVRHYLATVEALGVGTRETVFFEGADVGGVRMEGAVLLCPDSDFGVSHEWPLGRWVELGRVLRDAHGVRVAVAMIEGGRGMAAGLVDGLGDGVETLDATDLAGALAGISGYPLVVAADGSLPHVAGFAGATCVVLFGPNDASWRRPLGKHHEVVSEHVECAPCLMAKCPLDLRCQERLDVARVVAAVLKKLELPRAV